MEFSMPPRPRARHTALATALCLALLSTACDEEMGSPSTLEGPQILAVQFTPRVLQPGSPQKMVVLGHALSATPISAEACVLPWTPEEAGVRCSAEDVPDLPELVRGALPLGTAPEETPHELSFSLPPLSAPACTTDAECYGLGTCVDGACPIRLWIKLDDEDDGGALKAIAQLATGELLDNPEVSALSVAGDESALPDTLAAGATLTIQPTVSDPYGEGGRVVTYFASAGSFDPWRTNEAGPSTYTAPAEAEEVTLTVIVRDPGGGVGWAQHTLSVTEAP